ncbi:MAG: GNAT family N-acetyltransferase [Cyclobacteriaceae bacterium]|nr:GNAT family N-acetyltransferase [Cyclobacteriaceae bacterium]HNO32590.1 GNAT family N-acetyltransferase [Anaerolineales bacterium]
MTNPTVRIRTGLRSDLPRALELIRELAVFEKAEHEVTNTIERMELDGFGPQPAYEFFVAERGGHVIGLALYYWRYSTWKGKRLYLEDIIVTESERRGGVGKQLFETVMARALEENSTGMMWQVLDWNEPAIAFYQKYHARLDGAWINCHLDRPQIEERLGSVQ